MSNLSSGYNTDVGYTYGFYKELAPNWLNFVASMKGLSAPSGQKLRYLELGCGYGLGLILLAAAHPEYEFLGVDFNPVHIAHGRKLIKEAGLTNIQFEETDFLDVSENWPSEWGQFDYVVAHGIYTWLDSVVRDALVKTIKHAASSGSLVYLSYNTMPGWTSGQPLQHLLRLWHRTEKMESLTAIREGTRRLKELVNANSSMTLALPSQKRRIESMDGKNENYLVHEYLHDGWRPIWFNQMVEVLSTAKLSYVGTASVGDLVVDTFLPQDQRDILAQYEDPIVWQVMLDVMVNQNFRKDVFTRGATQLWDAEKKKTLLETTFVILYQPDNGIYKFTLSTGEAQGKADIYKAYTDALMSGPKNIGELASVTGRSFNEAIGAMTMLMHGGYVSLYKPIEKNHNVKSLNRTIIKNAANGAPYSFLIAPETGVIFGTTEVNLIMANEILVDNSLKEPIKLAESMVKKLKSLGKSLSEKGQSLSSGDERLQQATTLADVFLNKTWVTWKKLGVV